MIVTAMNQDRFEMVVWRLNEKGLLDWRFIDEVLESDWVNDADLETIHKYLPFVPSGLTVNEGV